MPALTFDSAYYNGGRAYGYTNYRRKMLPFEYYADVIETKVRNAGYDPNGATVLLAGCAYGYTVEWCIDQYGMDAYGMDISQYAVDQASSETAYGSRIIQGDITNKNDVKNAGQLVSGKYNVILTEAVLSCLTDSEADTACTELRKQCEQLAHRVWATDASDVNENGSESWYTEHTLSGWQSVCDPNGDDIWDGEVDYQPR